MEAKLGADGILCTTSTDVEILTKTLIFLLGINLSLRASEHRVLRPTQFKVSEICTDYF